MLCNGNVPDSISPINFKNDSFCPTSSRDFSTLGNKSIMSLISIDSESHWVFRSLKDNILPFEFHLSQSHFLLFGYFSEFENDSYKSSPLLEYSASFCWIPYQVCKLSHH